MGKRDQPKRQWRVAQAGEVRIVGDGSERQFVARVCVYGVTDDYGTTWRAGCFTESLARKLPKAVWHHQWSEPIGRVVAFDDNDLALDVTVQLDDFEAVPRARQAWAQLQSGSLDEFSFGFVRQKWVVSSSDDEDWAEEMIQAQLDEVSPVLVGAVPGTKTLAVRSVDAEGDVDVQTAAGLAVRLAAGDIDLADALAELKDAARPAPPPDPEGSSGGGGNEGGDGGEADGGGDGDGGDGGGDEEPPIVPDPAELAALEAEAAEAEAAADLALAGR